MSFNVVMPALGESVTEGTVTRWLKNEGDQVAVDEPLLEVSTDKVDTEIPSPVAGTVSKILVAVDQTVPVGADLVVISDGASAPVPTPAAPAAAAAAPTPAPVTPPAAPVAPVAQSGDTSAAEIVVMPALGESVTEGTVTRWLKNVGDSIAMDEALLEVSTDKVDTEIPSPVAGTVTEIFAPADSVVPVGGKLAAIGGSGAKASAPVAPPAPVVAPAPAPVVTPPVAPAAPVVAAAPVAPPMNNIPAPVSRVESDSYVTPLVRKLAAELAIDLGSISGTGVGGRIRKQDVYDAAERARAAAPQATAPTPVAAAAPAAPSEKKAAVVTASPLRGTTVPMTRLRKVIASRMVESLQTSAQLTTVIEVDVTKIAKLRAKAKGAFQEREGVNLTFLPFFAVAVCEALKQHPVVNASIDGENIVYHGTENLGIAVDTERGLLVPVIKDAGDLNLGGLARKINDVALRTRDSKINPDELSGGTFTITNTGSRGALFDTPIINQPQVAILGIGSIVKRPVVITEADGEEKIAIRSMVYLAISYDHRIVDGADAARFLATLKERLELGRFEADLGL
jgi:pyruvate dehydrogenase E2 component (dihydrolipoamide acetyltransferase)